MSLWSQTNLGKNPNTTVHKLFAQECLAEHIFDSPWNQAQKYILADDVRYSCGSHQKQTLCLNFFEQIKQ